MKASDAFDYLTPNKWIALPPLDRIVLLEEIRRNLQTYKKELAHEENRLKNGLMGEQLYYSPESFLATTAPVGNLVNSLLSLYKNLVKERLPKLNIVSNVDLLTYDVKVEPFDFKERFFTATQNFYLRVKGHPKQVNPLNKKAGVIAIISSGSNSSYMELLKAIFLENKAVIHKPHRINEGTEKIWRKILKPLINSKVLAYCNSDEGKELVRLNNLHKIYFNGSEKTLDELKKLTKTTILSQIGGNNPIIVVPGLKPWTLSEIRHQANEIATVAKLNGGAICGRPQTILTCNEWSQRELFLLELKNAIVNTTSAAGTYYPTSIDKKNDFLNTINNIEVLYPENGKYKYSDFVIKTNAEVSKYSNENEAFFQFLNEIPINSSTSPEDFMEKAIGYCNTNLYGNLGCILIIDDYSKYKSAGAITNFVNKIKYKNIAINSILPAMFYNPYFSTANSVSNSDIRYNFPNLYGIENVEKSILTDNFVSLNDLLRTNKSAFFKLAVNVSNYVFKPSWKSLSKIIGVGLYNRVLKPDF